MISLPCLLLLFLLLFFKDCFILFGVAIVRNPSFGKRLGFAGMVLGPVAIAGIAFRSIAQDNPDNPFFYHCRSCSAFDIRVKALYAVKVFIEKL
jgi:hypothetical protein